AWDGVVILRIARRGVAGQLGFRPGDIIYSVNGETFANSAAMAARLEGGDQPRSWEIKFRRDGQLRTVTFH
ncbi:MAG TPA: PDZ domain-containing protein, partial [Kiloniellaceae bacterium]|nr:PDZ domain-containing protein [Kiloniellaceae bacterium]